MEIILNAAQAKAVDTYSIEHKKIPSIVLMERAALSVTDRIVKLAAEKDIYDVKVLCVCGHGNNGADGVAVARQLNERNISCDILPVGNSDKKGTAEYELQMQIADNLDIKIRNTADFNEYNIIVDAIFGIGLSRDIQGGYKQIIDAINMFRKNENGYVVAVDIPSGVNAADAHIMSCAVKADITVTFGYNKIGMVMYPGADYCGKIYVENIGFAPNAYIHSGVSARLITREDIHTLPKRDVHGNKGTFGRTFIIAGSENMGGAACMSALSAYRSGNGLVKVFTHINNRNLILSHVPEAIIECYDDYNEYNAIESAQLAKELEKSIDWSDCVIAGPGLSMSKRAKEIVECMLNKMAVAKDKTFIIDADALNIISADDRLREKLKKCSIDSISDGSCEINGYDKNIIITPHIGEMARFTNKTVDEIKMNPVNCACEVSKKYGVICILKDARTVIADNDDVYINTTGNAGMATGGSGDILTGIISGMVNDAAAQRKLVEAAAIGVYIHGMAGDFAKNRYGETSMKAMDIAQELPQIFKDYR